MTTRKPSPKPIAVAQAERSASVPKRQVIQHTKLLRANLMQALEKANDELANADASLAFAADTRDRELDAAKRAYETAQQIANEKFAVVRDEFDAERNDLITSIDGITAALKATEPKTQESVE